MPSTGPQYSAAPNSSTAPAWFYQCDPCSAQVLRHGQPEHAQLGAQPGPHSGSNPCWGVHQPTHRLLVSLQLPVPVDG